MFFLSFVAMVMLMPYLGFILVGSLYLIGLTAYMKYMTDDDKKLGGPKLLIIRSGIIIIAVVLLYLFFSRFLHVDVPVGFWENLFYY
ncbi:MAG: hypothetical protein LBT60_00885 [Oscillospiraceae bacterium]|nr:hypothetical protein [Oscillospiraceae bacterium]